MKNTRYVFAVLSSIGMAIIYGLKVNLSVAIVAMANTTKQPHQEVGAKRNSSTDSYLEPEALDCIAVKHESTEVSSSKRGGGGLIKVTAFIDMMFQITSISFCCSHQRLAMKAEI